MPSISREERRHSAPFDFSRLSELRLLCRQIQQDQIASLDHFKFDVGFRHVPSRPKISVSSTATCVLSLAATDRWIASKADSKKLLHDLIPRKTSAELREDNPFTTAWILEAVITLRGRSDALDQADAEEIARKEKILQAELENGNGGVSIETYPASGYLTQLVVRVLRRSGKLTSKLEDSVDKWAWAELAKQLALIQAKSKTQDAFAVAYLLMLVASGTPSSRINPEQASIRRSALKALFDCQLDDGSWPLSRPLFHYPGFGNAYCYEFEMLTQLLKESELREMMLGYLPNLGMAAESILSSAYRVEGGIPAWTSGHHPNQAEPESWATASVYHFIHELDRLLAEAVRRDLFRYLDQPLPRMTKRNKTTEKGFAPAPGFLDSKLDLPGKQGHSLRDFLWEKFVQPLSLEADNIVDGREFKRETPRSAIFFGPPGTSKTELAKKVADFLGWPLLLIDPSLLLRKGMDGMQGEANIIFRMLEETERVVVLFDEFDELVRERGSSDSEPFSRLLTTAMLPKLASIHKRATLVFIIATNHVGEFDLAIRRRGRFDRVVQIMPPTYEAKMTKNNWGPEKNIDLAGKITELKVELTDEVEGQIADLTFDECEQFVVELSKAQNVQQATSALASIWKQCTLQTSVSQGEDKMTWADRSKADAQLSH
jgi:hypothetical protein